MRVIKQMFVWQTNNPNLPNRIIFLRQQELEQLLAFLQPLAERHRQRLQMIANPPPELRSMVQPTEMELRTLGGFLAASLLPNQPKATVVHLTEPE